MKEPIIHKPPIVVQDNSAVEINFATDRAGTWNIVMREALEVDTEYTTTRIKRMQREPRIYSHTSIQRTPVHNNQEHSIA